MTADAWFDADDAFDAPLRALRSIALDCGLTETVKWRQPCYTADDKNVIILGRMKGHCVISFMKGALLPDPEGLLATNGPNTRSAKVVRFTDAGEVRAAEAGLRALIAQAVEAERQGLRVEPLTETPEYVAELTAHLAAHPDFRAAFEALTPGRQRAYNMHFGQAKQAATRRARIVKCTARIMDGKGLNDCVCGLSKRMPGCDGSHRVLKTRAPISG
ncbi:MAG: YdeI/OmpD-associated family protein [Myxococcales bacterium]|nr:YdeI/OmpD-associated family protein [Myxococcales bacterium]